MSKDIDVLLLLTPTPQHSTQIISALNEGHTVICEKSIMTSYAEVQSINIAKQNNNGKLFTVLNYSGYPMIREIRNRIISGEIGQPLIIKMEMPQEAFLRNFRIQDWRLRDYNIPTISLDLGIHVFHLAKFLLRDEFRFLSGTNFSLSKTHKIIDYSVSQFVSTIEQTIVQFEFGKLHLGKRNGLKIEVFGSAGSYTWIQEHPDQIRVAKDSGNIEIVDRGSILFEAAEPRYQRFKSGHPTGFIEALSNLYYDFHHSITTELDSNFLSSIDESIEFANYFDINRTKWKKFVKKNPSNYKMN
jgi:predicted dehydrogenase